MEDKPFEVITELSQLVNYTTKFQICQEVSLDTETTGLDPYTCDWLLLQLELDGDIFIFDVDKFGMKNITYLMQLLNDSNKLIIAHNAKFDIKVIKKNTDVLLTNVFDTQAAETVSNAGLISPFPSLDELLEKYLGVTLDKSVREEFHTEEFSGLTQGQLIYSALDVKYLRELKEILQGILSNKKLGNIFSLEMRLLPAVAQMELEGILLDSEEWLKVSSRNIARNKELRDELCNVLIKPIVEKIKIDDEDSTAFDVTEALLIPVTTKKLTRFLEEIKELDFVLDWILENVKLTSNQQLKQALNFYGIPVDNVQEKEIVKYKAKFPEIIIPLLEYKGNTKKITTYGESFVDHVNSVTGRIHSEFNQFRAATGRFGSSKPNLQNLPSEDEYRSCVKAREGYKLLTIDYSQAELRILGAVSGEPKFISAYKEGKDLHRQSASIISEVPFEEITKDQRNRGKTFNFAIVYGTTEWGLSYNLGLHIDIAREQRKRFFEGYPILAAFIKNAGEKVWELKYSITPLGRKRYFKDIRFFTDNYEYNRYKRRIKREGVNHIIQGGSADALKIGMCDIFYNNPFGYENLRMLLPEHDELVVEVHESIAEDGAKFVSDCLVRAEQQFLGEIPATVDYKISDIWEK